LRRKSDQLDNLAIGTERFTATTADATDKYSRQPGDTSMRGDPHAEQTKRLERGCSDGPFCVCGANQQ
jgi:hypothetical protein